MALELKKQLSVNSADPLKHAVGLSAVWQKYISEFHATDFRSLIPKEHGQLGKLKKSLGMKQATEVVEYAIRNWSKFAQKAATNVGSDIVSPKPSVGWLCQYHATALLMLHEELQSRKPTEEEKAKMLAQAEEVAKVALQLAAIQEPEHKSTTLEELEAIEAEVEAEFAAQEQLSA